MSLGRSVDDVLETIRETEGGKGCALLLGAGCSVTAGIPTAQGIVKEIEATYPRLFKAASEKTYLACMKGLAPGQRRDLIRGFIEGAKINWGHIAVAQLIANKYVSRVLTTNFDALVSRACAMVNEFPAVYDFGAHQEYNAAYVPDQAIFHLHGQHTGFRLVSTEEETAAQYEHIRDVINDCCKDRPLIVVGYSGDCDPVFKYLAEREEFDYPVYWVCFKDVSPSDYVQKELLVEGKYAYLVKGHDADGFFVRLAQGLGCFPPAFVGKPFTHLTECVDMLTPYVLPGTAAKSDATLEARGLLEKAINQYESSEQNGTSTSAVTGSDQLESLVLRAKFWLMAGDYDKVIGLVPDEGGVPEELAGLVSDAYFSIGCDLQKIGKRDKTEEGAELLRQACLYYEKALKIESNFIIALQNWGGALGELAIYSNGGERERLLEAADAKLNRGEFLRPGQCAYNLACTASLRGNHESCETWLRTSQEHGKLPPIDHMNEDTDLDAVRDTEWFKAFVASLEETD